MAKAEEAKKEGGEGDAPKKGGKKMLVIIIAVVVVLLGGVGGALAFMGGDEKKDDKKKEEHVAPVLKLAKMDPFLVNLSEQSSFLKAVILIEYDETILHKVLAAHSEEGGSGHGGGSAGGGGGGGAGPGALPHGMVEQEGKLRDAIIRVFIAKKASEVLSGEGKDRLKEELVEAINEALAFEEPPVTNVYFTEFIIQ